ncbi:regulatory protein GemA [Rhodopseudomonas palustris]|uniref:Regulatory protein GemA n=1 Tax=Rhodopseudomonas palustris (strain BisB18) TaxID=316056 RepID=Q218R3_RHOPB
MITPAQIALVHLAKKHLGWNEEMYRAVLYKLGGVESAKDLDQGGFALVMEYATSFGFRSDWTKRTYGKRPGMATPKQVDLIRDLWREWSGADDDAALNKWLDRHYKVAALRFATSEVASKAITGLRSMIQRRKRGKTAAGGP